MLLSEAYGGNVTSDPVRLLLDCFYMKLPLYLDHHITNRQRGECLTGDGDPNRDTTLCVYHTQAPPSIGTASHIHFTSITVATHPAQVFTNMWEFHSTNRAVKAPLSPLSAKLFLVRDQQLCPRSQMFWHRPVLAIHW